MKKFLTLLPILFILLLASVFRLYELGQVPQGLTWDEAAIGYNAYSLLHTGRDEYGAIAPTIFKSFGDYKPGFYIYLTVPFVALFDLTAFAVRLPSAIFGVLAVFGVYLLVNDLFGKRRLALFSALALAVMPWHIHFSRGAWEVNVFSTLLLFCLYFLISYVKYAKISRLGLSLIFALLSMLTYQAGKMLTPLLMLVAFMVLDGRIVPALRAFFAQSHKILVYFLIGLIAIFYLFTFGGEAKNRLERLSIFGYNPGISAQDIKLDGHPAYASFFHSPTRQKFEQIASRYLYHFSPEVLFYQGNRFTERGHIPEFGLLNIVDFVVILFGLYYFARHQSKSSLFVLVMLFVAPIASSLTLEEFSSVRSFFMTIPLSILIGAGFYQLFRQARIVFFVLLPIYIVVLALMSDVYLFHSFRYFAWEYNYGYTRTFEVLRDHPTSKAIVTDVYGQPYIYYLFSQKYDPQQYQAKNQFIDGGVDVGRVDRLDHVEFRQFSLQDIAMSRDTFFAGTVGNIPDSASGALTNIDYYEEITDQYNQVILRLIRTKP